MFGPQEHSVKLAGLAVLFSRQILNGYQEFFFFIFFRYETIETHARAFLPLIILSVVSVSGSSTKYVAKKRWVV